MGLEYITAQERATKIVLQFTNLTRETRADLQHAIQREIISAEVEERRRCADRKRK